MSSRSPAWIIGLGLALSAACGGRRGPTPLATNTGAVCLPSAPANSQRFALSALDSLVGAFDVTLMDGYSPRPRLHLHGVLALWRQDSSLVWPRGTGWGTPFPDSARRQHPEFARPLVGAFEGAPTDTASFWARSRVSPGTPEVNGYFGRIRIGDDSGMDGPGGIDLRVDWVAPGTFGGRWAEDRGFVVVLGGASGGYFCARHIAA